MSKRGRILLFLGLSIAFAHSFVIESRSRVPHTSVSSTVPRKTIDPYSSLTSTAGFQNSHVLLRLSSRTEEKSVVDTTKQNKSLSWIVVSPDELRSSAVTTTETIKEKISLVSTQAQDVLSPAAKVLDEATDGWALSYADLSPETESTPIGQAFLATNIAYAFAGLMLSSEGDMFLGFLIEVVSVASFIYHYTQLQAQSKDKSSTVRLALLVDYIMALTSILVGLVYLAMDQQLPPMQGLVAGGVGIGCLLACWVWEEGMPYIVLHSLWHLFSAYCGYVVGQTHLGA